MAGRGRRNADWLLVVAVAQGRPVAEAAAAAGISERTVYRRLTDPAFQLRVDEVQGAALRQAVGVLAEGQVEGAWRLRKLAAEGPPAVQERAARGLLEAYPRLRNVQDRLEHNLEVQASSVRGRGGSSDGRQRRRPFPPLA
jgi:hypothetical protein